MHTNSFNPRRACLAFACAILASSSLYAGKVVVNGKVEGLSKGRLLLVAHTSENKVDTLGSTDFTEQGTFSLQADVDEPMVAYVVVKGYSGGFQVIAEPGASYQALLKDGDGSYIKGGRLQDAYNNYLSEVVARQKQIAAVKALGDSLQGISKFRSASLMNDSAESLRRQLLTYSERFHRDNDNIISAFDALTTAQVRNMNARASADLYAALGVQAKASLSGRILQERVSRLSKLSKGQKAPDFTLPTLDGKSFTLSQMKGKVKIIDFWASWCGPCRLNNPALKEMYARYHDQGLEMVSISLDNVHKRWADAVAKDGLPWVQVSSLKGWGDETARQYNVTAIPAIFILNGEGEIIGRDIRDKELEQFVKEQLTQ